MQNPQEHTAFIGLGSNLKGDRTSPIENLKSALEKLAAHPDLEIAACSSCYTSKPVGPQDQNDFFNAVAKIRCRLSAMDLLYALQAIEAEHGRRRNQERRWGPRTLDLDILLFNNWTINEQNLQIPHPEILNRSFVLVPLFEIGPELQLFKNTELPAENYSQDGIMKLDIKLWSGN